MRKMTDQEQKAQMRLVDSNMGRIEKLSDAEEAALREELRDYYQEMVISYQKHQAVSSKFHARQAEMYQKYRGKWIAFHSDSEFCVAETAEEARAWQDQRGYDSDSVVVKYIWPEGEIRGFRPFRMKIDRESKYWL